MWARSNANPATTPPSRVLNAFRGNMTHSGTIRRRNMHWTIAPSVYEDEEEGYGSADWDETYEMTKIRVKVCPVPHPLALTLT